MSAKQEKQLMEALEKFKVDAESRILLPDGMRYDAYQEGYAAAIKQVQDSIRAIKQEVV